MLRFQRREAAGVISPLVDRHDPIILKSHGAITMGLRLGKALTKMEVPEHLGEAVSPADQLGRVDGLGDRQAQTQQDLLPGKRKRN